MLSFNTWIYELTKYSYLQVPSMVVFLLGVFCFCFLINVASYYRIMAGIYGDEHYPMLKGKACVNTIVISIN